MRPKFSYTVATPDTRTRALAWSGDPEVIFERLHAIGYEGVELFVRDPAELDAGWYRAATKRHGLGVAAVGTGLTSAEDSLFFTAPEAADRRRAIDRAKAVVDFAAELESQVNIGKFRGLLGGREGAMRQLEEAFVEVCAHAEKRGVSITLEPQNRFGIDNMTTTAEALAWVRAMNIPNLRLMLDVFHMQIDDPCLPASFIEAADQTIHVHFADTGRGCPGTGSIDFATTLRVLKALRYERYISLEINQTPDSETAARRALAYLHALADGIWP